MSTGNFLYTWKNRFINKYAWKWLKKNGTLNYLFHFNGIYQLGRLFSSVVGEFNQKLNIVRIMSTNEKRRRTLWTYNNGHYYLTSGVDSVNITIQILPDSIPELDETFTLRLHNVSEVNQRLQQGSVSIFVSFLRTFFNICSTFHEFSRERIYPDLNWIFKSESRFFLSARNKQYDRMTIIKRNMFTFSFCQFFVALLSTRKCSVMSYNVS